MKDISEVRVTFDGQVAESSACGALDLYVIALEEIKYRLEGVLVDRAYIALGDFGKCK